MMKSGLVPISRRISSATSTANCSKYGQTSNLQQHQNSLDPLKSALFRQLAVTLGLWQEMRIHTLCWALPQSILYNISFMLILLFLLTSY